MPDAATCELIRSLAGGDRGRAAAGWAVIVTQLQRTTRVLPFIFGRNG